MPLSLESLELTCRKVIVIINCRPCRSCIWSEITYDRRVLSQFLLGDVILLPVGLTHIRLHEV